MKQTLLAVMLLAATATTALADGTTTKTADDDCKRARNAGKVCMLSFDTPDDIEGNVIKPDGEGVNIADAVTFTSLIRMRWDFRAEIIKAAEDVW